MVLYPEAYPGTSGNCGATLAANASCTLRVEFAPAVAGVASSSIQINYTNVTAFSATRAVTGTGVAMAGVPNAPSGLTAFPNGFNGVLLNWTDNSSDETGFDIYRSTSSGVGFTYLDSVGAGQTAYIDDGNGGNTGTTYYYYVIATNGSGSSAQSNEAFSVYP